MKEITLRCQDKLLVVRKFSDKRHKLTALFDVGGYADVDLEDVDWVIGNLEMCLSSNENVFKIGFFKQNNLIHFDFTKNDIEILLNFLKQK